jgi:hypothetical protein
MPTDIKNTSVNLKRFERSLKPLLLYTLPTTWSNIIADDTCGR